MEDYSKMSPGGLKRVMAPVSSQEEDEEGALVHASPSGKRRKASLPEAPEDPPADGSVVREGVPTLAAEPASSRPSGTWRAGFIRRVHVENFMRHQNFTVDFGPNVTFISGKNGSGKSATLQALQCCLGVRARKMGRGTSLGGFVRRGCHSALVVVTLCNEGEGKEAYKPEVFGDRITVERRIDTKGSGSVVIRDSTGKKVGSTMWELNRILDHLNLMVGNPAVVTTQDVARTFLSNDTNDASRYKLFLAATLLDQVKGNLSGTSLATEKMGDMLQSRQKDVDKTFAEYKRAKKQLEHAKSIEQHVQLESHCENVLAWKDVYEIGDKLDVLNHKLEVKAPAALNKCGEKLDAAAKEREGLELNRERRVNAVEELTGRLEDLRQTVRTTKLSLKELTQREAKHDKDLELLREELGERKQERQEMEIALREMAESSDASGAQALRREREEKIAEAQGAEKAAEDELGRAKEAFEAELAVFNEMKGELHDRKQQVQAVKMDIRDMEEDIERLSGRGRRSGASWAQNPNLFGQGYDRLLHEVEARVSRGEFRHPPVGPIGMHLELADAHWGLGVQAAIGNLLGTFVLHDEKDLQVFRQCARRAWGGGRQAPNATVSSFDRKLVRVPQNRLPPQRYATVQSVLRCNHPTHSHVVWNTLIDQGRVEATVLVDDFEQGKDAIFRGNARPASKAYDVTGMVFEVKGSGTQVSRQTLRDNQKTVRLSVAGQDDEGPKRQLQSRLKNAALQLEAHVAEELRLDACMKEKDEELAGREARIAELQDECLTLRDATSRTLEMVREALQEAGEGMEGMEAQISDLDVEVARLEGKIREVEEMAEQIRGEVDNCQSLIESKQAEQAKMTDESEAMVSNAQSLDKEMEAASNQVEKWKEKEAYIKKQMTVLEQQKAEYKPRYDQKREAAELVCPESEVQAALGEVSRIMDQELDLRSEEDMKDVEKLLKKMRSSIQQMVKECGSLEELELAFFKKEKEFENEQKIFTRIKVPYDMIRESLEHRWMKFESMRRNLQKITQNTFNMNMGKRGHAGQLKFSHKEETLAISVRMNQGDGKAGRKVKDMKSLSGGERSLSTLAFILALGTECESPFRAADEFDVFMDAVNRKVSLRTLLNFAVDNPKQQMILLTPQDLSEVEEIREEIKGHQDYHEKFIKLIRMPR